MSRLAKKPINMPEGVSMEIAEERVVIKGPKGSLSLGRLSHVVISSESNEVWVKQDGGEKQGSANVGTMWSLIRNAIHGVTDGFSKTLEIEGVGYRASMEGSTIVLNIGFSHPVRVPLPHDIQGKAEKNSIVISGIDKALVGKVAAEIRALKKPEPYLGKGIRYQGEVIRRKVGKKAATAGAAA